ncbi:MAG: ABC transporter permease [Chloroflexi bacterium]|nr:ABC transporter permease [Chloroflexota bacterium]
MTLIAKGLNALLSPFKAMLSSPFIRRRLLFFLPQLFIVTIITFILLKLVPGDIVDVLLGGLSTEVQRNSLREDLGLNDPVISQYFTYIDGLVHGDLGKSFFTGQSVAHDFRDRLPATLEFITTALVVALLIMIPLGIRAGSPKQTGWTAKLDRALSKVVTFYGLLAGSLADFWLALILIFLFYATADIVPEPGGYFALGAEPEKTTGFNVIDSIIHGDGGALKSYVGHMVLPVATLVFVYGGPILKMTITSMAEIQSSAYVENARGMGLKTGTIRWMQFRNALPPIITIIGVIYGFLLGGAVLVERIFSLNGFGNYGVESVLQNDFLAAQSFMLVAAIWVMLVYLIVDIAHAALDPRIRL